MFGSTDSDTRSRRKSFFLFGSSQAVPKISTSKASTGNANFKAQDPQSKRQTQSKTSSSKISTSNKNPFLHDSDSRKVVSSSNSLLPKPPALENSSAVKEDKVANNVADNKNNIAGMHDSKAKRSNLSLRRPPPPPIDMQILELLKETPVRSLPNDESISQRNSTEDIFKSAQYATSSTPNVLNNGSGDTQHKRQLSEAEKLVDDLDHYIKEHEGLIKGPDINQEANNVPMTISGATVEAPANAIFIPEASKSEASSIGPDTYLESPHTYVGPLNLPVNGKVASALQSSVSFSQKKSEGSSDLDADNDRFSFTTSLNDKSVKSIQQVALYDSTGAAPVLTNYSYDHEGTAPYSDADKYDSELNEGKLQLDEMHANDREFPIFKGESSTENAEVEDQPVVSGADTVNEENVLRSFRVVNEDRPSFYLNDNGNTTSSTTTTATENEDDADDTHNIPLSGHNIGCGDPSVSSASSNYDTSFPLNTSITNDIALQAEKMTSHPETTTSREIIEPIKSSTVMNKLNAASHESLKSSTSSNNSPSSSPHPDKMVRLVSSYVEESRLKYYTTSNFLQAPPNLPISLKQKNNLIQPKNIKVRIRTSSKQIGIKHGGAKQKLLSLETTREEDNENDSKFLGSRSKTNVDHTKEFHNLLRKGVINRQSMELKNHRFLNRDPNSSADSVDDDKDSDYYLEDIPGDDAYDSDDAMAPLRESRELQPTKRIARSDTVVSYFTKNQQRLRSGTLENGYSHLQGLPTNVNIDDYLAKKSPSATKRSNSMKSDTSSILDPTYSNGNALHVANPDTDYD